MSKDFFEIYYYFQNILYIIGWENRPINKLATAQEYVKKLINPLLKGRILLVFICELSNNKRPSQFPKCADSLHRLRTWSLRFCLVDLVRKSLALKYNHLQADSFIFYWERAFEKRE